MTEGDLLQLRAEIERRLHRIRASQPTPETASGIQVERPETDIEVLFRAMAAILDHLGQRAEQP